MLIPPEVLAQLQTMRPDISQQLNSLGQYRGLANPKAAAVSSTAQATPVSALQRPIPPASTKPAQPAGRISQFVKNIAMGDNPMAMDRLNTAPATLAAPPSQRSAPPGAVAPPAAAPAVPPGLRIQNAATASSAQPQARGLIARQLGV